MSENTCLEKQPLSQEMLDKIDAYWRAANLSVSRSALSSG